MANYANLLATIAANIYTNNNNEVTAAMVKAAVDQMVASLGAGYQFMGMATPATDPGTPDEQVFYIASRPGTYTDFPDSNADPIEVVLGEVAILYGSGSVWAKLATGIGNADYLEDKIEDVYTILSLNRFDKSTAVVGYLVASGEIAENPNYRTSDFIKVTPGVGYNVRNNYNFMVCIYDENKDVVAYYSTSNAFNVEPAATQIPAGGKYLRFSMRVEDLDTAAAYVMQEYIALNPWVNTTDYEAGIVADRVKGELVELSHTVSDMAGLLTYLSYVVDTDHYHYTIYLNEGTYTLTAAQIDAIADGVYGKIGILLPDNVDLVGLGAGAKIVCDLTGQESGYQQYISPLNIKWNNRLKNLTIEATNCRYAVHADNSNNTQNIRWEIENCTFIHHGNSDEEWNYPYAWGEGGCSGHYARFKNCKFVAPSSAFYLHNNTGFTDPMWHDFEDCAFVTSSKGRSFTAESLGSGTKDVLNFIGCAFDGLFDSRAGSAAPPGTGCDWVVIGTGNSPVCENWYYTDGIPHHSCFGDEVIAFKNNTGAALTAGTFMKYNSDELVPMENGDDVRVFVGFLLDDVADGGVGYVKVKGTYRVTAPSEVVWAVLGTKICVANYNTLGVATDINFIGKMYYRSTIYTRYYILLQ